MLIFAEKKNTNTDLNKFINWLKRDTKILRLSFLGSTQQADLSLVLLIIANKSST